MSYNYSNYTQFGIQGATERYAYAGWLIFVTISSLIGDTTILVASIKYKAFHIHKIVVTFIQHIAVCDLLNAVVVVLPGAVSVIANRGGSHKIQNYVRFFFTYYLFTSSCYFLSAMTLSKLLLLKYPLKTCSWSTRRAHVLCAGIWTAVLSIPTLYLLVEADDVIFDYRVYFCVYKYTSTIWKVLSPVIALFTLFAPNMAIIVSTVMLLNIAKKVVRGNRRTLRWQGILTVVVTATVYTLSFLPLTVYLIAEPFVKKDPLVPGFFYVEFYRVTSSFMNINTLANFFVYSLTVASFRPFLRTKFRQATTNKFNVFSRGSFSNFFKPLH